MTIPSCILGLAFVGIAGPALAEQFTNSYMTFELPTGWACRLEGTEWVCSDTSEREGSSAIIIMSAKEEGPTDRLDLYEDELSTPRPLKDNDGNPIGRSSRVEFVREERISGQTWIHGRQFESEVPNYYTDYFAGIESHIAILVTFSAHRSTFESAFARFYPSMASIRAVR